MCVVCGVYVCVCACVIENGYIMILFCCDCVHKAKESLVIDQERFRMVQ